MRASASVLSIAALFTFHVAVTSAPAGAYVSYGAARVGVAPAVLDVPLFGPRDVVVELAGYRTLTVRLPWFPRAELEVRLVPEHGGAGTWEPDEAE